MSRVFLAAFVVVTAIAVAGADYVNESRRAGLPVGGLAAQDWLATVTTRFDRDRAENRARADRAALLARQGRDHLPAAPAGWVRRDWAEADAARLTPVFAAHAREDGEVWVYEKPGALVAMRLDRPSAAGGAPAAGLSQEALLTMVANMGGTVARSGFAMVAGVPVVATPARGGADAGEAPFRDLAARIGPDVTLTLAALGSDRDILELLGAVDFARLNRLNETPLPGVGVAAPGATPADQLARAAEAAAEVLRLDRLAAALAELRMQERALALMHGSGRLSDADHAAALQLLSDRRRTLVSPSDDLALVAAEPAARPIVADDGDGQRDLADLAAHLLGLVRQAAGGASPAAAEGPAPVAARPTRLTVGDCVTNGTFKRCRAGN